MLGLLRAIPGFFVRGDKSWMDGKGQLQEEDGATCNRASSQLLTCTLIRLEVGMMLSIDKLISRWWYTGR